MMTTAEDIYEQIRTYARGDFMLHQPYLTPNDDLVVYGRMSGGGYVVSSSQLREILRNLPPLTDDVGFWVRSPCIVRRFIASAMPGCTVEHLLTLRDDQHHAIRRAAQQTLDRLQVLDILGD